MAISAISNAAAAGSTVAMPSHATDDCILASVWRNGSTTAATVPAGWNLVKTQTGTTSWMGVYAKFANSASETTGTWTNATAVEINVYRGVSQVGTTPTGGTGTGTTITYPAITLNVTANSTSWVYRTACAKAATNITTNTPTGYTAGGGLTTTGSAIRGCDSNAGLGSSPATGTQVVSGSGVWIAISVELLANLGATSNLSDPFSTGPTPDSTKWTTSGSATVSGGELLAPASSGISSLSRYNLTGDLVYFQVGVLGAASNDVIYLPGNTIVPEWGFDGSLNQAQVYDSTGVNQGAPLAHTPGNWYRFRESGGTLYWDYSTNGFSWTNAYSEAASSEIRNISITLINVGTGTSHYDNVNVAPPAPTNTGTFFAMF